MTALITNPHPETAPEPASEFNAEQFAQELDALRAEVLGSLGTRDAKYIRTLIRRQRQLEIAGRAMLMAGLFPPAWIGGVTLLALSKILENMEIGHNVIHGQWDWMRDPKINSQAWEWDTTCPAAQWKHTHNHVHHYWTNVIGKDGDVGYDTIRIDESIPWEPKHRYQVLWFSLLMIGFEWGVGFQGVAGSKMEERGAAPVDHEVMSTAVTIEKMKKQLKKDYVLFPALALPLGLPSMAAVAAGNLAANLVRNVWTFAVIFCGHFPDKVALFTEEDVKKESRGQWYRRQVLGSANFTENKVMDLMTGNLNHQIEHHLYPDMPSNRYAQIAPRVRDICARHGVFYNTGSFTKQFGSVIRKTVRYARQPRS
jgi:fatty acid desaturase